MEDCDLNSGNYPDLETNFIPENVFQFLMNENNFENPLFEEPLPIDSNAREEVKSVENIKFKRQLTLSVMKLLNPSFVEDTTTTTTTAASDDQKRQRKQKTHSELQMRALYNRMFQIKQRLLRKLREPEKVEQIRRRERYLRRQSRKEYRSNETAEQAAARKIKQREAKEKVTQRFMALATTEEILKRKNAMNAKRRIREEQLKSNLTYAEKAAVLKKQQMYYEKYKKKAEAIERSSFLDPKTGRIRRKPKKESSLITTTTTQTSDVILNEESESQISHISFTFFLEDQSSSIDF